MNLILLVLVGAACIWGIVGARPRLPAPGNIILVVIVALVAVLVLLSLAGIVPGGVTLR